MISRIITFLFLLIVGISAEAQVWTNVQNMKVKFTIKNAGISIDGTFTDVNAKISVDEKNIEKSTFEGVIQTQSVNTGNSLRDDHLKNKSDFFDVKKFPTMTMKSLHIGSRQADGSYKVEWLLTMKGISKKITTNVLFNMNGGSIFLVTMFEINRLDWKVGSKSIMMGDKVTITLTANMLK